MIDKYEAGGHNSMRDFLYYGLNHKPVQVLQEDMNFWTERIQAMLEKHSKKQVDIWEGTV